MTPKEKAYELLLKYLRIKTHKMFNGSWHKMVAKQCALIAVDEAIEFEKRIIKEVQFLSDKAGHAFRCEGLYWEQVKHEIQKL